MRPFPFLLALVPSVVVGQGIPATFDARQLVPRTDSFVVRVQGQVVGATREVVERLPDGFRLTSMQTMAGMSQETRVELTPALGLRRVEQSGEVRGQQMRIRVTLAGGRARGSATTPGSRGVQTIAVDVAVPAGAVDDNALQSLLPALPLAPGKTFAIPVLASGQGAIKTLVATVHAIEPVTVPAGTFEAWRVEVSGGEVPVTFWVGRTPRRVVKLGFAGAPMTFELAR